MIVAFGPSIRRAGASAARAAGTASRPASSASANKHGRVSRRGSTKRMLIRKGPAASVGPDAGAPRAVEDMLGARRRVGQRLHHTFTERAGRADIMHRAPAGSL